MPPASCSVAAATRSVIVVLPGALRFADGRLTTFAAVGVATGTGALTFPGAIFVVLTRAMMLSVRKNDRYH
jgi:hypothetical protein